MLLVLHPMPAFYAVTDLHEMHTIRTHMHMICTHVHIICKSSKHLPCCGPTYLGYMLRFFQDIMRMLDIDALMLLSFGLP